MTETLYSPPDIAAAHQSWGANCGPVALAAVLRRSVNDVRDLFPGFAGRGRYVNPSQMFAALAAAGASARRVAFYPDYGLAFVQVAGSWLSPGVPPAAAYRYTHWAAVALRAGRVFDVNAGEWQPFGDWADGVMSQIVAATRRATGWHVRLGIEVAP